MRAIAEIRGERFEQVLSTAPIPVLVHFYAQWSAPCRLLASELAMLAPEFEGRVEFVKTDIDHSPELAARYDITTAFCFMTGSYVV